MKHLLAAALFCAGIVASAQTVTVKDTTMVTYGYSDPDLVPRPGRIYPYHRYQTFAFDGAAQTWKMVVLENDFLRVKIFPEIGGKVWSIYDKKEGKEMFYDNGVVKFRDISLRGPWTSGGIEWNFGIIGHAPSCASPVDYKVEKKEDGSVSCYIGVQELLSRSRWMIEINLPKDAVWLRTRTFWHNYSDVSQPYYHWANSGVTASDDMEIIYPATYTVGHGGDVSPYPEFEVKDFPKYSNQKYGADKSLHPGGSHKGYFGTYWRNDDFGVLHYAQRDEKLGRKYFSWAQSPQGEIWVDLLTDSNPQYVELQSGRLFNQNFGNSSYTPYKQFLFTPFGTDEWNEYWLPFAGIGGVDDMTLRAVVNVSLEGEDFKVGIFPLRNLSGEFSIRDAEGRVLASRSMSVKASESHNEVFRVEGTPASMWIGGSRIWSSDSQVTDRPNTIDPRFSKTSAEGNMVQARCLAGMRSYQEAEVMVDSALTKDPGLLEAYGLKSMLCFRRMDYAGAYSAANQGLAIDTYDPASNYYSGLAAWNLGKKYDAMDRLELAALTSEFRSAAFTKLGEIHFCDGERDLAGEYARKSLVGNQYNVSALMLLQQCSPSQDHLATIERLDPLNHFPAAERFLAGELSAEELYSSIFEELKWQNYLEFAAWYHSVGLDEKAVRIIEACPEKNALLGLWAAYLRNDPSGISGAEALNIDLVFPFREESYAPLKWAVDNGGAWQSKYLLAMLSDYFGRKDEAAALVSGNDSDYAPYYAYRSALTGDVADVERARALDPEEWRYVRDYTLRCVEAGETSKALSEVAPFYAKHKDNFRITDAYVRALMAAGQYSKADKVMSGMRVLPFEGQSDTHSMYRDIKLELARQCMEKRQYRQALKYVDEARLWPERLGAGKPYDNLLNTSAEDSLEQEIRTRMNGRACL
jgi:hypothetical protein